MSEPHDDSFIRLEDMRCVANMVRQNEAHKLSIPPEKLVPHTSSGSASARRRIPAVWWTGFDLSEATVTL